LSRKNFIFLQKINGIIKTKKNKKEKELFPPS
jgi:hypothetical protein